MCFAMRANHDVRRSARARVCGDSGPRTSSAAGEARSLERGLPLALGVVMLVRGEGGQSCPAPS